MWIEAESAHYRIVNSEQLIEIEVRYKGSGVYHVIGVGIQHEMCLKVCACEKDAETHAHSLFDMLGKK
jgi:hypothetical protein